MSSRLFDRGVSRILATHAHPKIFAFPLASCPPERKDDDGAEAQEGTTIRRVFAQMIHGIAALPLTGVLPALLVKRCGERLHEVR